MLDDLAEIEAELDEVDRWYGDVFTRVSERSASMVVTAVGSFPGRVPYSEWLAVAPQFYGNIFDTADFFCQLETAVGKLRDEDKDPEA